MRDSSQMDVIVNNLYLPNNNSSQNGLGFINMINQISLNSSGDVIHQYEEYRRSRRSESYSQLLNESMRRHIE